MRRLVNCTGWFTMAKATDRIDRTIEFWRTRRIRKFLLTQKTIELLKTSISALDRQQFTLQHVQALNLAVSLFEAQLRDCLRSAIDGRYVDFDAKSEFLDIKIDVGFINQMRSRRLTLGEFVFINTGISTVERLWGAMSFCFPYYDYDFRSWYEERGRSADEFAERKTSLAWVYSERNRYVHEFFDDTALALGKSESLALVVAHLSHAYDFLTFVQRLKESTFSFEYPEDHPSWGETGKAINETNKRIEQLIMQITDLLPLFPTEPEVGYSEDYIEALRSCLTNLIATSEEYTGARVEFAYTTFGPGGTARNDIAAASHLAALQELESILTAGLESVRYQTSAEPENGANPEQG